MTLEDLVNQLNIGTAMGQTSYHTGDTYGHAYNPEAILKFGAGDEGGTVPHLPGESGLERWSRLGIAPFGAGADWEGASDEGVWESTGAASLAARLANMYGYAGGGAPEGTSWDEIGMSMSPVTVQQLQKAQYGSMRPGIDLGVGSLTGELLGNLGKVKSGGFASSGFTDKRKQIARDVFGKKASDILVSEGKKRQDYMQSLLDQSTANQEIMQSWFPAGGSD